MNKTQNLTRIIVETTKGSSHKFDYDPEQNLFVFSKVMHAGVTFPFDFGFIPATLGQDGDPLDVIMLSEADTFTGCAVNCRIIGVLIALQKEKDGTITKNDRFIAVSSVSELYRGINGTCALGTSLLEQLKHFFVTYNEQAGKSLWERLSVARLKHIGAFTKEKQ